MFMYACTQQQRNGTGKRSDLPPDPPFLSVHAFRLFGLFSIFFFFFFVFVFFTARGEGREREDY